MEFTSNAGMLNDSCEDLFLTQNSFNPPENYSTQNAVDDIDALLTFNDNSAQEEDWREHKSVHYFDFTYQVNNGSSILASQDMATEEHVENKNDKQDNDEAIIPLISDLHLDNLFCGIFSFNCTFRTKLRLWLMTVLREVLAMVIGLHHLFHKINLFREF